jgi:hypothetical protein
MSRKIWRATLSAIFSVRRPFMARPDARTPGSVFLELATDTSCGRSQL